MKKYLILLISLVSVMILSCDSQSDINPDFDRGVEGRGGSMSSFSIIGNELFVVTGEAMKVYNITDRSNPQHSRTINVGTRLETTFILDNYLYVGSQTGMYIYDISNPNMPVFQSVYQHVTACDPVVVTGNTAYVTIRDGQDCRFGQNLLDVLDVSDKRNPMVLASYPMQNPHGLAVDQNFLFVCEGAFGLKVFNISNRAEPVLIQHIQNIFAYDVLAVSGRLIITGDNGFLIYDYTQIDDIKLLSSLTLN